MSEKPDETSTPAEEAGGKLSFTLTAYRDGRQVGEMEMSSQDIRMVCVELLRGAIAMEQAIKTFPALKVRRNEPKQISDLAHRIQQLVASTRRRVVDGVE